MSFKVGQKVVAIRNHSTSIFKKGDVFTVLQTGHKKCCGQKIIDIGILHKGRGHCSDCDISDPYISEEWWVAADMFVPIQDDFQSISLTKILEKETPLIGVN